ncbi:CocE/NonD family hydrolase [Undibacterium sp. Di26W]|uniref:CocE/NonD family hydrolase n=1 Tax=Undibacterium sp. Di26W TaxID=3413035 RepID=UPI003BEFEE43
MRLSIVPVWLILFLGVQVQHAYAQADAVFIPIASQDKTADMETRMATLAKILQAHETAKDWDANQLFRLQLLTAQPSAALSNILAARAQAGQKPTGPQPAQNASLYIAYELYARAIELQTRKPVDFATALKEAFGQVFTRLDNLAAMDAEFALGTSAQRLQADFERNWSSHADQPAIPLKDALSLCRQYLAWQVYARLTSYLPQLLADEELRRYEKQTLLIPTADGAQISSLLIRPKAMDGSVKKLTTLLGFTIYANDEWSYADAKKMAVHDYAGMVSYTRGKGSSTDAVRPFEHDGDDARTVIDWISKQAWSDGRVGMFGGSYSAFTQWAAAKKLPAALKAMATSASTAPGIDVPMEGNVFMNFMYPWIPYVTNKRSLDEAAYADTQRWQKLNHNWYQRGLAYRGLDGIDGVANPIHRRWLQHPAYDSYWQSMIPYRQEFSQIHIPILTTTGYFDGAQVGALYYFQEHTRYLPKADHTLLIGPYNHFAMQGGVAMNESGYAVDEVARLDLQALRLQWFDHQFKGSAKPALLKDRINYQVMGANIWKHVHTLADMQQGQTDYYLGCDQLAANTHCQLLPKPSIQKKATKKIPMLLSVDMAKRDDIASYQDNPPRVSKTLTPPNALLFLSAPLQKATEISGLFAGHLELIVNKKDVDLLVTVYEQMPNGDYFELASFMRRASYAKNRSQRQLLQPGKRQVIDFTAERITSRQAQAGSRIIISIGIPRQPDLQINYGSGKDVSDESIADAGMPIQLQLLDGSYLRLPLVDTGNVSQNRQGPVTPSLTAGSSDRRQ